MADNYVARQYKQTAIKTSNRCQILLMLYEAAIQYVKKAVIAIEKRDLEAKGVAIGKAHDIINELINTLDFNVGGNIAQDLDRLYNFMVEQLIKANLENTKEPLLVIQKLLETLLDGWKGAIDQVSKGAAK